MVCLRLILPIRCSAILTLAMRGRVAGNAVHSRGVRTQYVHDVRQVLALPGASGDDGFMPPPTLDYQTFTAARTHLKDVFDASEQGRTVTVGRDDYVAVVVAADRLRDYFFKTIAPRITARFDSESQTWFALMEGRPFVSEGLDLGAALEDLALSLREYAEDWEQRLQSASNHSNNWALVQLVKLSSPEQLLEWMQSGGE